MLRRNFTRQTVFKSLQIAKENGVLISYDPNVRKAFWSNEEDFLETQRKALGFTDVFLSTLKEATLITGARSAEKAVNRIIALGPSKVVIRAKDQYLAATPNQSFCVPIFKAKAIDTSGAGDAFDAGFLTGLIKGWPLDHAVVLGSAVAALKVMKIGTRSGLPRMEEALKFIKENRMRYEFSFEEDLLT